jgi:hypothetical protein
MIPEKAAAVYGTQPQFPPIYRQLLTLWENQDAGRIHARKDFHFSRKL